MGIQRSTWSLVLTACLLGGIVYLSESQREIKTNQVISAAQSISNWTLEDIQGLGIKTEKYSLVFEKRNVVDSPSQWQMKQPQDVPANAAAISFLTNLLVTGKPERVFPLSLAQLADYGLNKPIAIIEVKLKNNQTHLLRLGKPELQGSSIYAQLDNLEMVYLLPVEFQYAVNRELKEWQQDGQ